MAKQDSADHQYQLDASDSNDRDDLFRSSAAFKSFRSFALSEK